MVEMNYKPKFYDCILKNIKQNLKDVTFVFINKETDRPCPVDVDQPKSVIEDRMREIISGSRDKLYLTHGMRDIDVSYIENNRWQLFDEYDVYDFEMVV